MLSARRAAGLVAASVPAVVVGGSSWYREKHRPELPPHTLRDLSGEVVVVTGATSGIGKAVAGKLAGLGATVVVGSRDQGRGEAARRGILASVGGTLPAPRCEVLPLDLSDLGSVRTFADECRRRHAGNISVVVAVAAEIVYEEGRQAASGADLSFATNQLGLQALLAELEPELGSSPRRGASGLRANRRVVIVGSRLEARGSVDPEVVHSTGGARLNKGWAGRDAMLRYADTKLCNMLLAATLAERWRGKAVDVLAVTPGMVHTGLWRHFPQWYQALTYPVRALALRSADDAAQGVVFAAAAIEADGKSGAYLSDGLEVEPSQGAKDGKAAARLYEVCGELIAADRSPRRGRRDDRARGARRTASTPTTCAPSACTRSPSSRRCATIKRRRDVRSA
mmetsp:Transcript_24862/g.80951  ORF Transcript_24862/g.80951 Transcript_24862/m.80951 type:complete len:397 (-) Transcript_24862:143-1333(-)